MYLVTVSSSGHQSPKLTNHRSAHSQRHIKPGHAIIVCAPILKSCHPKVAAMLHSKCIRSRYYEQMNLVPLTGILRQSASQWSAQSWPWKSWLLCGFIAEIAGWKLCQLAAGICTWQIRIWELQGGCKGASSSEGQRPHQPASPETTTSWCSSLQSIRKMSWL